MRKRKIIDELWWKVWDAYELDRVDLSEHLMTQADNLLSLLDLEDQLLLIEFLRETTLNRVEMLDFELWTKGKAEEGACHEGLPVPQGTGKPGLVAEILQDEYGLFLALRDGWACELTSALAKALIEVLRNVPEGVRLAPREEEGLTKTIKVLEGAAL